MPFLYISKYEEGFERFLRSRPSRVFRVCPSRGAPFFFSSRQNGSRRTVRRNLWMRRVAMKIYNYPSAFTGNYQTRETDASASRFLLWRHSLGVGRRKMNSWLAVCFASFSNFRRSSRVGGSESSPKSSFRHGIRLRRSPKPFAESARTARERPTDFGRNPVPFCYDAGLVAVENPDPRIPKRRDENGSPRRSPL